MEPTPARNQKKKRKKSNTLQEVFVSVSLFTYSALWLPLAIEKYEATDSVNIALNILLFSFLCTLCGSTFFLISILCNLGGYQKAAPIFLIVAAVLALAGQFVYDHEYCSAFFAAHYPLCFISQCLAFLIYIMTTYYLTSLILSRTNFKIGLGDLASMRQWFGSRVRVRILLFINLAMLARICIDMQIYSYSLAFTALDLAHLDVVWVAGCVLLALISGLIALFLLRFQKCIPWLANKVFLVLLLMLTLIAFVVGAVTVWKHRVCQLEGYTQIANVFIWTVVNCWMLVEFMTQDINTIMEKNAAAVTNRYANVAQTEQEVSEIDNEEEDGRQLL